MILDGVIPVDWVEVRRLAELPEYRNLKECEMLVREVADELKIIQEIITLTVFAVFAMTCLGEKIRWNHVAAFICSLAAVAFTLLPKK